MSTEILKNLLLAHKSGDELSFWKAAAQLASKESRSGHNNVAEELRAIIADYKNNKHSIENSMSGMLKHKGSRSSEILLEASYRKEKYKDVILKESNKDRFNEILKENRRRSDLLSWGVSPTRKLLFYGPPGCGKTLTANVLAGELNVPLYTVRLGSLFSRYLGETSQHLKQIFDQMPNMPGVYLFDEFDAVGKDRKSGQDVGEVRRVVNTFLQLLDSDQSNSMIIAATNFEESIDDAIYRRFDDAISFPKPTLTEVEKILALKINKFGLSKAAFKRIAPKAKGMSFSDITKACDRALRKMILSDKKNISEKEFLTCLSEVKKNSR